MHVNNRLRILAALREELLGPSSAGQPLNLEEPIRFSSWEGSYGPWKDAATGEEILTRETPSQRYGVGVLFPLTQMRDEHSNPEARLLTEIAGEPAVTRELETHDYSEDVPDFEVEAEISGTSYSRSLESEGDDFDLSSANRLNPSSMGISFLVDMPKGSSLIVEVPQRHSKFDYPVNGRYKRFQVEIEDTKRDWWVRVPITIRAEFADSAIRTANRTRVSARREPTTTNLAGLNVQVEVFARPHGQYQLVTVSLINRTDPAQTTGLVKDEMLLFQSHFRAFVAGPDGRPIRCILPYPESRHANDELSRSLEEESLALLYRSVRTYAIGHGCAADWDDPVGDRVIWVSAEPFPIFEVPNITPNIRKLDGSMLPEIPMQPLAGLVPEDDGFQLLQELVDAYQDWIREKLKTIPQLPRNYHRAAAHHLAQCAEACERMKTGLDLLRNNDVARKAFQLANRAVLLQQIRGQIKRRALEYDCRSRTERLAPLKEAPDPLSPPPGRGKWRPFQIAFLLMTIESVFNGRSPDREVVELIWFPTGGGKTEAYLALAAFSMFSRRLKDPADAGVEVLMRYTLRLLTAQQFQRAASLICAMEHIRRSDPEKSLGDTEFSIGIWVGGDNTPNTREKARRILRLLERSDPRATNTFVLTQCPWCAAQIGPIRLLGKPSQSDRHVRGYEEAEGTVILRCTDPDCEFRHRLPVYVIDEDIYDARPTFVIGTVDKFAMLAWNEKARALFGRDQKARQVYSPPGLIIQDELHLISGPLGSMVGLYETVVEELCTDRRGDTPIPPKIVCSTATIRRYREQVAALYARQRAQLFPPPGIDASDSFFAQYERNEDGSLAPGRMYVGVHAPALGSMQTVQVRTFAALLQAPVPLSIEERDPWWTQLNFFNSLRELGTTLTLFQSDIRTRLQVLRQRYNFSDNDIRYSIVVRELTSRIKSDKIPAAIAELQRATTDDSGRVIDVCLASSIIEVGVDIERLSLMSIVGQPKNTAQYIQVSGRVGRHRDRPGLVITLYSASKARDRSHFERFRTYHEQLYAQVEPTSVTPFSRPVLERALHAIMVAYVRQAGGLDRPYPFPEEWIHKVRQVIERRVRAVDPAELNSFVEIFEKRVQEWRERARQKWTTPIGSQDPGLIYPAGAYAADHVKALSWPTPTSLRDVDAECLVTVTTLYNR